MFLLGFIYCIFMAYFINNLVEPRLNKILAKEPDESWKRCITSAFRVILAPLFILSAVTIELILQYINK